jgi:DNA-binding beta-propeller fold protein YncE
MKTILAVNTAVCAGLVILLSSTAQAQNLFVTGGNNSPNSPCIAEFAPDGTRSIFTTNVDDGVGLAFDSAGNLFEADSISGNIYEFTPGGARSTFASGAGHPYGLGGLAFNSAGNLFLADEWDGNIYKFTPGGSRSTFASGLNGPFGLAFNSTGNLFVSDEWGGEVYQFTPGGSRSTFASGLRYPTGLAFDSAGNLFLSQGSTTYPNGSGTITKFTTNGGSVIFASGNLGNLPYGLAFDSAGNLYLASASIQKFTPDGTRTIFAGGMDSPQFLAFQPVPEPSTSVMVMLGSVAILVNLQRHRRPS